MIVGRGGTAGRPRAAALLCLAAAACAGGSAPPAGSSRLVLVGVDGASWDVLSPLMRQGRLPNLARLYRSGSAGLLRSILPASEAALWTTLATGLPPSAHGIASATIRAAGLYEQRPIGADRRQVPALWTLASARGVRVGVAGWPNTFPVEPLGGFMIADGLGAGSAPSRGEIHPDGSLSGQGPRGEPLEPGPAERAAAGLEPQLESWLAADRANLARALSLYRVHQPRLLAVRFASIDAASHLLWQYHEPRYLELARTRGSRIDPNESARLAGAIPAVCDAFDEWLGELMARLPADATLMLVSDHGFKGVEVADAIAIDLNGLLEALGYLERSADGTIAWPRTRAFNLPDAAEVVRGIHLNLAGRDEAGTVNPAEAAALLSGLAGSLADLRPDAGPALFRSIRIAADPKAGEPELEVVADDGVEPGAWVLVGRGRVRVRDLYGRVVDLFGVHAQGGILLASGPGIARGRTGWQASLIDVAPTVLHLLGLPPSRTMQGRRVEEILDEPPGRELPQADSYEDVAPGPGPLNRPARMIREEMGRLERLEHVR